MFTRKFFVASSVMTFVFVCCSGCLLNTLNKVCIDRQFLFDIKKAYQDEMNSGRDMSKIYNKIWNDNYDELIYLTTKGDRKAIDVSISLIGQKEEPVSLFEEIELIIKPTFEGDSDYFLQALEKKPPKVQIKVLYIFDHYKPIDWCLECYLNKHLEIKKLFEHEYGPVEKNIQ